MALSEKAQVQVYAQRASGDPVPTLVINGDHTRIQGRLLLAQSVLGARAVAGEQVSRSISYSSGSYDSGWLDLITHLVDVDDATEFVDFNIHLGAFDASLTGTAGSRFTLATRLTRNGTQVWPPSAITVGHLLATASNYSTATASGLILKKPVLALDFPPSSGEYTYKWQVRATVINGTGAGNSWSIDATIGRVLLPKNQI